MSFMQRNRFDGTQFGNRIGFFWCTGRRFFLRCRKQIDVDGVVFGFAAGEFIRKVLAIERGRRSVKRHSCIDVVVGVAQFSFHFVLQIGEFMLHLFSHGNHVRCERLEHLKAAVKGFNFFGVSHGFRSGQAGHWTHFPAVGVCCV